VLSDVKQGERSRVREVRSRPGEVLWRLTPARILNT